MNAHTNPTGASVIPTVRYRNVAAAVEWLQDAFGFEQHRLVKDSKGSVLYAELTFGTGMVMVAPIQESPFGKLMVQPDEIGGVETQICYLFVDDAAAHRARAKAAGAEIVLDIKAEAKGGRGYSCRDPEGHVWNFGTHNPWNFQATAAGDGPPPRRRWKALAACLLLALASGVYMHEPARTAASKSAHTVFAKVAATVTSAQAEQTPNRGASDAQDALRELRDQLSKERLARVAADRHVKDLREQLAQERRTHETADSPSRDARETQTQSPAANAALKVAEAAAAEARSELAKLRSTVQAAAEQLAQAQRAKDAAERVAKDAREQFAQLRSSREAAEQAAKEARDLAARERKTRIAAERILRNARASPYTPYPLQ